MLAWLCYMFSYFSKFVFFLFFFLINNVNLYIYRCFVCITGKYNPYEYSNIASTCLDCDSTCLGCKNSSKNCISCKPSYDYANKSCVMQGTNLKHKLFII